MPDLTRRQSLALSLTAPAVALAALPAAATGPTMGPGSALFNRFRLGAFEVTILLTASRTVEKPQEIFGLNASPEDFAAVSTAAFLPTDRAQVFFAPTPS